MRKHSRHPWDSSAGFTLIELSLVVTVVGILAAIAVPSLIRARGVAAEVQTVGSLRHIHGAQMSYATACGSGYYAPSVPILAKSPKAGSPAFISPEFTADTINRQGYRIRFTAGTKATASKASCNGVAAGQSLNTFFVGADLLQTKQGLVSRYFGVNQMGTMYESTKRVAPFYAGNPPSPARPLK